VRVAELMSSPVVTAPESTTLQEIARLMLERHVGSVPIVDAGGRLVGIVTDGDFVGTERSVPLAFPAVHLPHALGRWIEAGTFELIAEEVGACPVREVMSSPVATAREDDSVQEVVERMISGDIGHVPVVRDGRPVGIVTRHDVLRLVAGLPRDPS